MRAVVADVAASGEAEFGATAARLGEAVDALEQASAYLGGALGADLASALAGATSYLRLFGLALGGVCLAKAGLAASSRPAERGRIGLARFFRKFADAVALPRPFDPLRRCAARGLRSDSRGAHMGNF